MDPWEDAGVCIGKVGRGEGGKVASGGEVGEGEEHLLLFLLLCCGKVDRDGAGRGGFSVSSFWERMMRKHEMTRPAGDGGKQGWEKEVGKPSEET